MKAIRIVVFAKAPLPGLAKTRLIPALGEAGAAKLARRMLDHTLSRIFALPPLIYPRNVEIELCVSPDPGDSAWSGMLLPSALSLTGQGDGDLGTRLARAAERAFSDGVCPLFIGTDCPEMSAQHLADAIGALDDNDVFLNGTTDGGYALLALRRPVEGIFVGIDWSTEHVFGQTVERILAAGCSMATGNLLSDIDEPQDLRMLPEGWLEGGINETMD